MRFFELEDRPVAVASADKAFVFTAGSWREASPSLARKALSAGSELSSLEFLEAFPNASKDVPASSSS
jgi:hypothetical protein